MAPSPIFVHVTALFSSMSSYRRLSGVRCGPNFCTTCGLKSSSWFLERHAGSSGLTLALTNSSGRSSGRSRGSSGNRRVRNRSGRGHFPRRRASRWGRLGSSCREVVLSRPRAKSARTRWATPRARRWDLALPSSSGRRGRRNSRGSSVRSLGSSGNRGGSSSSSGVGRLPLRSTRRRRRLGRSRRDCFRARWRAMLARPRLTTLPALSRRMASPPRSPGQWRVAPACPLPLTKLPRCFGGTTPCVLTPYRGGTTWCARERTFVL